MCVVSVSGDRALPPQPLLVTRTIKSAGEGRGETVLRKIAIKSGNSFVSSGRKKRRRQQLLNDKIKRNQKQIVKVVIIDKRIRLIFLRFFLVFHSLFAVRLLLARIHD